MSLLISSPHTHSGKSVHSTMLLVMLALAPATIFGLYLFGLPAISLFLITILGCVLAEAIALKIMGKPVGKYLSDGSAILTGWLLALSGYVGGAEVQAASALGMIRFMYLWIPVILIAVVALVLTRLRVETANQKLREEQAGA